MTKRHYTLYRTYDADGRLLYVGCSATPHARLGWHCQHADWWLAAARVELEHLGAVGKVAAYAAEAEAIRREHPMFNSTHNAENPHRVRLNSWSPPARRREAIEAIVIGGSDATS